MTVIRDIVFDLGGVLIDWNPRYLFRSHFAKEPEMEFFLTHICNSQWNEQQDAGRTFADGERELIRKFPKYEELILSYFGNWEKMIGGDIPGTVKILEDLANQANHRLFVLSNWSSETFHFARERFLFLDHFRDIMISGEEGLIKPDPRFFKCLIKKHDLRPEASLFIDDVKKNIDAASALGFKTIHFKDPESLRGQLKVLDVHLS